MDTLFPYTTLFLAFRRRPLGNGFSQNSLSQDQAADLADRAMRKQSPAGPDRLFPLESSGMQQYVAESAPRLHDYLYRWATERGESEAVVTADACLTCAMLKDAVDDCARGLIAAGAKRGDRIATLTVPGPEFLDTVTSEESRVGKEWGRTWSIRGS